MSHLTSASRLASEARTPFPGASAEDEQAVDVSLLDLFARHEMLETCFWM